MSKLTISLFLCLCLLSFSSKAQDQFMAGTSKVSLEPDNSIFSVALGGYGFPREGRFSLKWQYVDQTQELNAITSLNGKFYASAKNNDLLEGVLSEKGVSWKKIGSFSQVRSLAALNGKLYAVTDNGLWLGKVSSDKIKWNKIASANKIASLTAMQGKLYGSNSNGDLLSGTVSGNSVGWSKISSMKNVVSMAAYENKVYAINSGDSLWSFKPLLKEVPWTQIGRNNSITFNIHVKHINVLNGRLYAVSADNKLYIAEHSSTGSLTSRALAIKNKDKSIVIVGVDVTGFNYTLISEIKNIIFKRRNIPQSAILINASHTHFAPVTQAWTTWGDFYHVPDTVYLNKTKAAIIQSIELALDNMTPSDIYFGRGTSDIGINRRRAANPAKPYDKTLDVLKVEDRNTKKIKTVLFLTGCHPVFKNAGLESYNLDANYPGVAKKLIQEKTNAENAIFIQGCAGDIDPKSDNHIETGEELTVDVMKVLGNNMTKLKGDISFAMDQILIPVKPWSRDSVNSFKRQKINLVGDVEAEKDVRWADLMNKNYDKGNVPITLPLYVQTLNIGDWKFVGLSREVVTEYGPAIRKIFPDKTVTVAGYCNDVSSYLPIDWHIKLNLYEGFGSFFWYGQSGLPPENILDIITGKIKSFNR